ncbi:MAG: hypothetical protein EXS55_03510 [Candidatus Magasanikbacteria bacterium]|nr:hypothetical protein [Candidatus Magasanikbacteria bacterium]
MLATVIPLRRMPASLTVLDYLVPANLEPLIKPGQLVSIPFRSGLEFAIVHSLKITSYIESARLKTVIAITLERPIMSREQLAFLEEMATLYATPLGFLIKSNLPPLQKRKLSKLDNAPTVIPTKEESLAHQRTMDRDPSSARASLGMTVGKPKLITYSNLDEKRRIISKLSNSGQTLILVPTKHDIPSFFKLLSKSQKDEVVEISSELSVKEMFAKWFEVWRGEKQIVLGTRRALFLSFFNLERIIVDDEGNPAHKSWDMAPRFHTRDAALLLSHHTKAELTFLTHTPSVESFYFASKGIYEELPPPRPLRATPPRAGGDTNNSPPFQGGVGVVAGISHVTIINIADERRGGNYNVLAETLVEALREDEKGVAFLYLNRLGSAHYIACRDCGLVAKCLHCGTNLTYHEKKHILTCHHCDYNELEKPNCSGCGGTQRISAGAGTELLEKELRNIFGKTRNIIRVDSDDDNIVISTTRSLRSVQAPEKSLAHSNDGQGSLVGASLARDDSKMPPGTIIVGTAAAWGVVPFEKITLCAFVDADTPLFVPEYKMTEELWQAVRSAQMLLPTSQLFIQTSQPEHIVFSALEKPELFYESELAERKRFNYPPFFYLVKCWCSGTNEGDTKETASFIYRKLITLTKDDKNITISSPIPAFPAYFKGQHRYIILAKISYQFYKKYTKLLVSNLPVGWKVDPNPNSVLGV